jgi:tetratricopeptide (TPR) repeat protein
MNISFITRNIKYLVVFLMTLLLLFVWQNKQINNYNLRYYKESDSANILVALYAFLQNDLDSSSEYFKRVLNENPNNIEIINYAYISTLLGIGVEPAINLAKEYLKDPKKITGNLLYSLPEIKNNQYDRAYNLLNSNNQYNKHNFDFVIIPLVNNWLLAAQNKCDMAVNFDNFKALEDDPFIIMHKGLISSYCKKNDMAKEYFLMLPISQLLPLKSRDRIAKFYAMSGDVNKAKEIYQNYMDYHPLSVEFADEIKKLEQNKVLVKEIISPKEAIIDSFNEIASGLISTKLYNAVDVYLAMSLYLDPNNDESLFLAAKSLHERNIFDKAYAHMIDISPDSIYFLPTQEMIEKGEYDVYLGKSRKEYFLDIISKYPNNMELKIRLAQIYYEDKEYNKMLEIYENLVQQKSDYWLLYYMRGVAYERSNNWDNAEKDFIHALNLQPNQADTLNYLGYSWAVKDKNLDKAFLYIENALKQRPEEPAFLDSLGYVYYKKCNYIKSKEYLVKAIDKMPEDAAINDHLGDVEYLLGNKNEAILYWSQVLDYSDDDIEIKLAKDKIANGFKKICKNK